MMIDNKKVKEYVKEVNAILWKEWNPIGCALPEDEYSTYTLVVSGKIWNGANKEAILDYLFKTQNDEIGMTIERANADRKNGPIVDKLIE